MMIRLTSEDSVSAELIAELTVDTYGRGVYVTVENGRKLWVNNDYGKTSYETKARLENEIEKALGNVLVLDEIEAERPMNRREKFAAACLGPLIARHRADVPWEQIAPIAFRIADGMIEESGK